MSSPNDAPNYLDLGPTVRGLATGQELFGRYTLGRILGRGGMGVVWLARDNKLDRDVALKFLPELVVRDLSVLEEMKREARRSLELTHHNIVRIYDFAQNGPSACISMEYIDGSTLSALRVERTSRVFEVRDLLPWTGHICAALDYAHNVAKIVHRDLKPANLMLSSNGEVKVADFGIARSLSDSMTLLTGNYSVSGTLAYMSPQQLDGERASHLDDIYSLGATLYELLTSRPPFYRGQIDRQIREKNPPSLTGRREELQIDGEPIPPNWEVTIAACLAKDPAERPQNVAQVAQSLAAGGAGWTKGRSPSFVTPVAKQEATSTPAERIEHKAFRSSPFLVAGILGLIIAFGTLLVIRWSPPPHIDKADSSIAPASRPLDSPASSPISSPLASPSQNVFSRAVQTNGYPPPKHQKEGRVLDSPDLDARLEQWLKPAIGSANEGRGPRQIWLVSERKNEAVQLPDFTIPKLPFSGPRDVNVTANSVGHSSTFSFSPNGGYLFRSQKLALGIGGAYLYRRAAGLHYEIVMPDLFLRACEFFTQTTRVEWKEGVGIVELSAWGPNNNLILVLRGTTKDRSDVLDWRCTMDPITRQFSEFTNDAALQRSEAATSPSPAAVNSDPGLDQMKPPHAQLLRKWLLNQSNLRLASISDYSKEIRSQVGKDDGSHAFYVTGDFNRDGIEDFAVKLVRDGRSKEYHLAVFNGSSGNNQSTAPAFTKGGFEGDDWLSWSDNELIMVDSSGVVDHIIRPKGSTYVVENRVDV